MIRSGSFITAKSRIQIGIRMYRQAGRIKIREPGSICQAYGEIERGTFHGRYHGRC